MKRLSLFNQTNVDLNYYMWKTTFPVLLFSRVSEIKIFSPLCELRACSHMLFSIVEGGPWYQVALSACFPLFKLRNFNLKHHNIDLISENLRKLIPSLKMRNILMCFHLLKCTLKDWLYDFSWKYPRTCFFQDCQRQVSLHGECLNLLKFF